MKLKKILLASATVAAFSAVMSISALAEQYDITSSIEYTPAKGSDPAYVTVTDAPVFADGSSYTMLILNTGKNGEKLTTIANTDIKQIGEEPVTYKNVKIPVALDEGKTYEVKMGGNGDLYTGTFTVPKAGNPNYDDGTRLIGDVDKSNIVDTLDAQAILKDVANVQKISASCASGTIAGTYKDAMQAADIDDNTTVDTLDAQVILKHVANVTANAFINNNSTISEKSNFVTIAE